MKFRQRTRITSSLRSRASKLVIDGGQCQVGIESTVFDVVQNRVLRPGMISAEELNATIADSEEDETLLSPGMLEKHYSPHARVVLANWSDAIQARDVVVDNGGKIETTRVIAHEKIPSDAGFASVAVIPHDAEA